MLTRIIPSSGEKLPVIGCGTYRGFDVPQRGSAYERLPAVLDALFTAGGSVIDSSPMYGRAEAVAGALLTASKTHERAFVATKVWTRGRDAGIAQMQQSMDLLGSKQIDLMQIHNLLDWKTHLATLRSWKESGRIRYLGVSHYTASAFGRAKVDGDKTIVI
jgi:diketogulonate reductase-like aldo/keto reductase